MRTRHFVRSIMACAVFVLGCTRVAEPTREPPASVSDERRAPATGSATGAAVSEPIRLPFVGASGNAEYEYIFTETLPSGGVLTYQRWRGLPEHPGAPITRVRVRSARFAGVGGFTPVYVMDDGDQHVFRRGPAASPYQANLIFTRSTDAEVDGVLARTEVALTAALGTELPAPVDVCVGPVDALRRHRAVPSRAGVYDPEHPIQGEHLNWRVDGLGCVTYPALSGVVPCEGAPLPWVATTLCQR